MHVIATTYLFTSMSVDIQCFLIDYPGDSTNIVAISPTDNVTKFKYKLKAACAPRLADVSAGQLIVSRCKNRTMFSGIGALARKNMLAGLDLANIEDFEDDDLIPELEEGERLLIRVSHGTCLCLVAKMLLRSRLVEFPSNANISPTTRLFQGALLHCAIKMTRSHFHNNDLLVNNIDKVLGSEPELFSESYQHVAVYREMLQKPRKMPDVCRNLYLLVSS